MIAPKITQKVLALAVSCMLGTSTKLEFEIAKKLLHKAKHSRKHSTNGLRNIESKPAECINEIIEQ